MILLAFTVFEGPPPIPGTLCEGEDSKKGDNPVVV